MHVDAIFIWIYQTPAGDASDEDEDADEDENDGTFSITNACICYPENFVCLVEDQFMDYDSDNDARFEPVAKTVVDSDPYSGMYLF
jgi:hypothetical protein